MLRICLLFALALSATKVLAAQDEITGVLQVVDADTVLDAMVADPILINRPLVETEKGVALCRPQDEVLKLL